MMDNPITREECMMHTENLRSVLKEGFEGVHDRLDKLNGRTEKQGNEIAVLKILDDGKKRILTVWDLILIGTTVGITFEIITRVLGYHL